MPSVDTNVLVRLVTKDDPRQYAKIKSYLEKHRSVFVSLLSVFELVWVLVRRYALPRESAIAALRTLLQMSELEVEAPDVLEQAIDLWEASKPDTSFADCFILATAQRHHRVPLVTFDRNLARLPDTLLL